MRELSGQLAAKGFRFGIAAARFNERVCDLLLEGAIDALVRHGADESALVIVRVPGAFEVPQALRTLGRVGAGAPRGGAARPDALIGLGCLVRGETPHFAHLAQAVTGGLLDVSGATGLPVANGVLTCDTMEQALDRAGGKLGNKGFEAATTAIEMASLARLMHRR